MAVTTRTDLDPQSREIWSELFEDELRAQFRIAPLLDRSQDEQVKRQGDIVASKKFKVSQLNKGTGQLLDIDTEQANTFSPAKQSSQQIEVSINKRAVSSRDFADLVDLQTQVDLADPKVISTMAYEVSETMNGYIYGLSTTPTSETTGTASISATTLTSAAQIADNAQWPDGNRWAMVDATYWEDLLNDSTLTSADFVQDSPVMSGMILQRYGWNLVKDTSPQLKSKLNGGAGGVVMFFLPDYLALIMQQDTRTKASDKHSNNEFGAVLSMDKVFGASIGNDGADKFIIIRSGS